MHKQPLYIVVAFCLLGIILPATAARPSWTVQNKLHIGGAGGWDYLTVDPETRRLYVPRSTHTQIINADSGEVVGDIPGQKIAHGVALAPEVGRGFISDGGAEGAVLVFDLKSNAVLGKIVALPDADGIIYDRGSGLVLVAAGDSSALVTFKANIDPMKGKIDAPINLGGKPEFLAANGNKAFVALEDKDQIAEVDLTAHKVVAHWPVAPGGEPVGLALDSKGERLFIGCRKPQRLIVMSTKDGKVIRDLPIGAGVDAVKLEGREAFASCRDGSLVVVSEPSPDKFEVSETVRTPEGARTMGVDPKSHRIYLPTAEFQPAKPGQRPVAKPDTFMIVVVSRAS